MIIGTPFPPPLTAPELTQVGSQQIYDVNMPDELQIFSNPSLVFRIEDQLQPGEYVYQWMVDVMFELPTVTMMEHMLDLSSYIGQTVNVSYAFATSMGLSEYSEAVEIHVVRSGFGRIEPVFPSDSGHSLVTESEDEAVEIAYCHVACVVYAKHCINVSCNGTDTESNVRILILLSSVYYNC